MNIQVQCTTKTLNQRYGPGRALLERMSSLMDQVGYAFDAPYGGARGDVGAVDLSGTRQALAGEQILADIQHGSMTTALASAGHYIVLMAARGALDEALMTRYRALHDDGVQAVAILVEALQELREQGL